ncbi:EF-P beta-lysylation protein EpmB [Spongiibacter taiwanensis]|uniref:EF-P beta-lysylation protein EpmB n=1 Tax=Spongiibacter taiwanensis TaxID=1748242 RepID=UPI00203555E6|nr:EF-P beta-lysylation protein EpmB [Spongiibacter taiwanensis]USA42429.1 EF-P beta-lysylation protein EpmB [Spongiibacter taiwanensis]
MIPVKDALWQTENWQQQMRNVIREPEELMARLGLDPCREPALAEALKLFPLRVPEAFVAKMTRGDWRDPLLLQVMPSGAETVTTPGFSDDPLEERSANPVPGLIHKYRSRALLITTPSCAINCRYCFRRSFPYQENSPARRDWHAALNYIAQRSELHEVILSGGDPLVAKDQTLAELIKQIAAIEHITTLRIHTRLPLVMPARVTAELIDTLCATRLQTVVVVHCNHPNELDTETELAFSRLRAAGVTLLNQSVLLAGINDTAEVQVALQKKLFSQGVLPYYLHLLDRVQGAAHFQASEASGIALIKAMRATLPGYLVPRLVRELPGEDSKTPIAI